MFCLECKAAAVQPSSCAPSSEETAMRDITEAHWKTLKGLRERALERFAQRILGESQALFNNPMAG